MKINRKRQLKWNLNLLSVICRGQLFVHFTEFLIACKTDKRECSTLRMQTRRIFIRYENILKFVQWFLFLTNRSEKYIYDDD